MSHLLTSGVGSVLRLPFALLKLLRPQRPIHPDGVWLEGTLRRVGAQSGVRWIDEVGEQPVRARFSRSAGLPRGWPDILGLALRCHPQEQGSGSSLPGRVDLLLATVGGGSLTRFLPTFHRHVPATPFSILMPLRGPRGPVLIAARGAERAKPLSARPERFREGVLEEPWRLELSWASLAGHWQRFGLLELSPSMQTESERFDPFCLPPGASAYPWTVRLRAPSYSLAQRRAVQASTGGP